MRPLVTPEEMAAADKAAIDAGTPAEMLMDRAGRAVARAAIEMLGGRYGKKIVVVCGKGNNGGDGYAAARILRREGVGVTCLSVVDPGGLTGAAREHHDRAKAAGVLIHSFDAALLHGVDLVIDAIWGTGYAGPRDDPDIPDDPALDAVGRIGDLKWRELEDLTDDAQLSPLVLAVDIPSGIHGGRGVVSGIHVIADRTVALAAEKIGTFVTDPLFVGDVDVVDIGVPITKRAANVLEGGDVARTVPRRRADSHKRSSGSIAVLAGSNQMTGAAALVVQGALRAGAGYVTVVTTPYAARVVRDRCPEALVREVRADHLGAQALDEHADVFDRADVVAIGPGIGQGDGQRQLLDRVLQAFDRHLVIDADGLNVLAGQGDILKREKQNVVITPHPVELARLIEVEPHAVNHNRVDTVVGVVRRFDCACVLKGFRSVIGYPADDAIAFISDKEFAELPEEQKERFAPYTGVEVVLNPTGGPTLATAGTGDVLTGVIAAWLAASPYDARYNAVAGAVYVHGLAGDLLSEGAVAWDVAEALPDALAVVAGARA